ncbi:MAG: DegT/DnrJ/EryC1/StrS family aminotransferase, partial [Gemmatimonadales bacterium]|nr:DegT/DnrJ/EryC1/StrS family aminotransferase [Gemmatimonadales bacterium]
FNGNMVITTSGGGLLVTVDAAVAGLVRKLASQARDPAPHYQHSMIGYNYRLSNLLAALGRGQLRQLDARVATRRAHFAAYADALAGIPGVAFMPEAPWGTHSRWLTTLTLDPGSGLTPAGVAASLDRAGIESRPVWKPMHLQPVFADCEVIGGDVSARLFRDGLCLPSGSNLTLAQRDRVIDAFHAACTQGS